LARLIGGDKEKGKAQEKINKNKKKLWAKNAF
jgi:hypothetical protein